MALIEEFLNHRTMSLKEMLLLLFLLLSLGTIGIAAEGRGSISMSKEEDLELERQLKIINKPAVKTIKFALQSTLKGDGGVYGSRAVLNVWEPKIIANQNSAALVILLDASPSEQRHAIQAGWMVNNDFYYDFHPHLYTGWTNDNFGKTGCHDVLCSGFVQISNHIYLHTPHLRCTMEPNITL
ncbi:protein neprosin-like [Tasmannia lanceolata]|uniref:protein neprosin-like n=1 Tax=Tasmannia lanceolata TaxID=3420 RepID=UPI004063CFDC